MEQTSFGCQVCLTKYSKVRDLKSHVHSSLHQQKMAEVFQKDMFEGQGFFPYLIMIHPRARRDIKQPILGLSLMTLCFSPETDQSFYLCHVCEEKRPPDKIIHHLSSIDHFRNYFNYTNPNVLNFGWIPSMDSRIFLRSEVIKEVKERGQGQLQLLDLPKDLLNRLERSTYAEVMCSLGENDKLLKLLKVTKPKRTMIQTYQRDSNRKHPLLGMQHLVECICVGPTEKRYYLCTLCNLPLADHTIIKHVLSFDHIFCYFRAWHPSTLLAKESYMDYNKFAPMLLNFAKQTEEIHNTSNTDMKQVSLEPAKFTSVNFACYAEAFKALESIRMENNESGLITSVKPGNKLVHHAASVPSGAFSYKLRCQNCSVSFDHKGHYSSHLSESRHKEMLTKLFGGADGYCQELKLNLGLYLEYLKVRLGKNQPVTGVPLVVMCISTRFQEEPFYVCFACEECFPQSFLMQHFDSPKHVIHTLLYQNPWRLPLAWKNHLDVEVLRSMAWEEEKEKGQNQMTLKVFDIPHRVFQSLNRLSYSKVMERLNVHRDHLKSAVPQRETYSKLQQNERFPLLGFQFLVMHDVCVKRDQLTEVGFLCLLCERRLSDDECYAHVFSWEHVATFLDRFHPGSQNSSTDVETLLDLAKQATRFHPISHAQVIKLNKPIWEPCSYSKATQILQSAAKREKICLIPQIMPKKKLFPRQTLKYVDKDGQKNSRLMEGGDQTSQNSTDNAEMTLNNISVEVCAEVTNTLSVETPSPSEKESEKRREVFSKTSSEEIKSAGSETCQAINEKIEDLTKKMEDHRVRKTSGQTLESCKDTDKNSRADGKDVLTQLTQKRKISQDTCSVETAKQEMSHKRQRLISKEDSFCEQNLPSNEHKEVTTADTRESGKSSYETTKDKASSNVNHQQDQLWQYVKKKSREPVVGLSALLECHCDERDPIYFCECCSLKIPEKDIITHITGHHHQKIYLGGLQRLPPAPSVNPREEIRRLAASFEQENGYGEAQVVDLNEDIYNNISKQSFESAIQTVKGLWDQQHIGHELPVDTSATLDAENKLCQMVIAEVPLTVSRSSEVKTELTAVGPLQKSTNSKLRGSSQTEANLDSAVTNSTISAVSKLPVKSSSSIPDTTESTAPISNLSVATYSCTTATTKLRPTANECTATTSKCTASSSTPSATISSTTSITKSATLSKPPERTGAAAKVPVTSCKAATASNPESTVLPEAACKTTPVSKMENVSKKSENAPVTVVASQIMMKSVAPSRITKPPVKCENTPASVKAAQRRNSVGSTVDDASKIHKSKTPAAPYLKSRCENKNPLHTSTSKTKPKDTSSRVGLDQLIVVRCGERKRVYCQLCLVVLTSSSHPMEFTHQFNYVKKQHPGWNAQNDKSAELRSKLAEIVSHLAEIEKNVGSPSSKEVEVKLEEYKKLADLPVVEAIERLKEKLEPQDPQVLSPPTAGTAQVWKRQIPSASPYGASSPDEEMYMQQDKKGSGNQSEQEKKHELKALLIQNPEIESSSKEEGTLAVGQSDRAQSVKSSEPEANDTLSDQLHSWPNLNKNEPNPSIQDSGIAVQMQKPLGAADSTGGFDQTCDPEMRQQQERRDPKLQDTQVVLEGSEKADRVSNHSQGESAQCCSNLSKYLKVLKYGPIIGLGSMWECRGIMQNSFYLCERCRETLSISDICRHMLSDEHKRKCIIHVFQQRSYPLDLHFWLKDDLLQWMEQELVQEVAQMLSKQEHHNKTDAQVIIMRKDVYEYVRKAPFDEALRVVQNITNGLPICTPLKDQQPEARQSPEESFPMKMQPAQAPEMGHGGTGASQKTEKHNLEEPVAALDEVKQSTVLSRRDMTGVSSKPATVVSHFPGARACLSPREEPEPRCPVSQHQRPFPELEVKKAGGHSEPPPFSIVSPKTQSVSPRDKYLLTGKSGKRKQKKKKRNRPAVGFVEALTRTFTSNPKLEDPLSQPNSQVASESTSVNPPATSTLLSPKDKATGPGFDKPIVDMTAFTQLIALVREKKSEKNLSSCTSIPGYRETTNSCVNNSSENGMKRRWDPKSLQTTAKMGKITTGDLKSHPSCANSAERVSTAAPVILGGENQPFSPNADFVCLAKNSSLEGSVLTNGNLLLGATEANAVITGFPSASTADPSGPQRQRSVDAQSTSGNKSQLNPSSINCEVTHADPGTRPQARGYTETDNTGVRQLPINTIVTVRHTPHQQQFMVGYKGLEDHTEVNRVNRVTRIISPVGPVNLSDASVGYGQCSQMAYVINGQSGYFSSEAVRSYTTPNNPPVYSGSSYQCEGRSTREFYPSRIYPEQEANHFRMQSIGRGLAAPPVPERVRLSMQQYSSWTCASLAAGDGRGTNDAAYVGAVPFPNPVNNPEISSYLNEYSTSSIAPTRYSNHIAPNNTPHFYLNPPVINNPATANVELSSQASTNSFFASGTEFLVGAPSVVHVTRP
ncbi:uncharacterized protein LOC117956555 isoform X2 [Etheostoma cragini]|uniref:uncharacterized protein LOC117956555 isoform X2 n=1 Tax=Etheostoma cragini TaxID=417921 RepID=UPI00155E9CFD|nr:uncharacterized protein LOC117956555 isoform X2 [Etheostoma cragini]